MTIWFSSDTHFDHSNIIRYCNRPFTNVDEMNSTIIKNWNSVVAKGDTVYLLGDFAFSRKPNCFFYALNGCKHLIKGNHDRDETLDLPWNFVKDVHMLKVNEYKIWLSHYSHRIWPEAHHGVIHLFGHSHNGVEAYGKSFDVGVDCWAFSPISLEKVIQHTKNMEEIKHH